MFRGQERHLDRLTLELGLKIFRQLDDESIHITCRKVFDAWRPLVQDARQVNLLLWIGDGDEVFNWRGNLDDTFNWNNVIGFCNLKYGAYPESRHYRSWQARPYMPNPPQVTYRDLQRIVETLRIAAKESFGIDIAIGTTIDAGPEFVESPFKFERHPELLKGGPHSEFPKSLAFLCCYAGMKADRYPYAAFPQGVPEGIPFGTFLGRQFESLARSIDIDFVWFSNGFGLTHYAWNYLGEIYNGLERHPERAPESIRNFVSFWNAFRQECPTRPILIRGTNFSIGMDATVHGIDLRELYRAGQLEVPAPNPPWGSSNLGLEMAAHLSRISSTPTRAILFRYYFSDSWFASVPWYDFYNREPFDIYCPLAATRLTETGQAQGATDLNLMTVNTGFGEFPESGTLEVTPHIRRAFDSVPDEAGPLVWVYPFSEYQDELHKGDGQIQKSFFGDWFIARAIAGGLPLCTVITTDGAAKCVRDTPEVLSWRVLIVPTPAAGWKYADKLLDYATRGGQVLFYGSLHDAPPKLLEALNLRIDKPIEGDLEVKLAMAEDIFEMKPRRRPLRHLASQCDGGVREVLAEKADKSTLVRATVARGGQRRVYAVVRQKRVWKGGKLAWIRGTLPFEARPDSLEPLMFKAEESHDAAIWIRYLLADFGIHIRQTRHTVGARPVFVFASRSRGSYFFSGHKPDATVTTSLSFPDGAPLLCERQCLVKDSAASYHFDRSFHLECQVFIRQERESLVVHKEIRTTPAEMRIFTVSGLDNAVLALYVPQKAVEDQRLQVRKIVPYTIQDPAAAQQKPKKKSDQERVLKWKVNPATGAVIVEKVSGTVQVSY
jgi:hypothetical protein